MSHFTQTDIADQRGKTIIVTGANSGIGFAAATHLARAGAHVVLACRSEQRGTDALERLRGELPDASIELRLLDLGDLASVRAFADGVRRDFDQLHVLVNNAGIMFPPFARTKDGFESQFGVNHLGHFALTGLLLPLLDATEGARVVTVSSVAHKLGGLDLEDPHFEARRYSKLKSYGQSKLANLLFTYELQRRLEAAGSGVQAMAVHPGWTATNLQDETGWIRFLNPLFAMPPAQGSLPTVFAAVAEEAKGGRYYGPHGAFEWRGYPVEVGSTKASHDEAVASRLWSLSEDATGVTFEFPAEAPAARPRASA